MLETTFKTDLFRITLHCNDIQDFVYDGTMFYYLPAKFQITAFLKVGMRCEEESLINSVLAMYEQETNQNLLMPRDQKLDTMVKTHVDQMIRTRIFEDRTKELK